MEKFKKLNREEMKKVIGGVNGCGWCVSSGNCSNSTQGVTGCSGDASVCTQCTCDGVTHYPCQAF